MSGKKQNSQIESIQNAATGYTTVALGIVCFLLALAVVTAGVRLVVGAGLSSGAGAAAANVTATSSAKASGTT